MDFIDRALASFAAGQRPLFDAGLSDLAARVATISGLLANPAYGGKAGWRAIDFDDRFVWAEPFGWYDGEGAPGE